MADTILKKLSDKVKTRLQTILVASGFQSNLGSNIFRWRMTPIEPAEMPGAAFRFSEVEVETQAVNPKGGLDIRKATLEVVIAARETTTTTSNVTDSVEATLLNCARDVEDALRQEQGDVGHLSFGGLALCIEPVSMEIQMVQEDKVIGEVKMVFKVKYRTRYMDPTVSDFNS